MANEIVNGTNKPMYFGVDLIPTSDDTNYLGAPGRKWKVYGELQDFDANTIDVSVANQTLYIVVSSASD